MTRDIDRDYREPGRPAAGVTAPEFETFDAAFDYCRESSRPVTVVISGERWKLYPSGKAVRQ